MPKLYLAKEEKLTLENNMLKENNLQMQISLLQNDRQQIIKNLCEKNSKDIEEIININVQEGYMEFRDLNKDPELPSGKE